jgi:hypothetical protein
VNGSPILRELVSIRRRDTHGRPWAGHSASPAIVMGYALLGSHLEMAFVDRDQIIQALAA